MVRITCTVLGCDEGDGDPYKTEDVDAMVALEIIKMHRMDRHAGNQQPAPVPATETRGPTPRGKIDMPTLPAHCTSDRWDDFLYDWKNYKAAMGVTDAVASAYLYGCLEEELRRDLRMSNPTVVASEMIEADLLKAVKELTVKVESILAHRIKLGKAVQAPGQGIRTFHAQLKGLAAACNYKASFTCTCSNVKEVDYSNSVIQDQLIRGIADQDILADLLGDEKSDRSLDQIVEYIARKEQAKLEQGVVTTGSNAQKKVDRLCRQCMGKDHGSRAKRIKECPAKDSTCAKCDTKGHFTKACMKCKDCDEWGHKSRRSQKCSQATSEKSDASVQESGAIRMMNITTISANEPKIVSHEIGTINRNKPISHHIFTNGLGWRSRPPKSHPTMEADVIPSAADHDKLGYPIPPNLKLKRSKESVVCDTGCMSTAIPLTLAYKLGFSKKTIIPAIATMNGAGKNDLGVVGAIVIDFKIKNGSKSTKQLCYVCKEIDRVYLSLQGLQELELVDENFPRSNSVAGVELEPQEETVDNNACTCSCPKRPKFPPAQITVVPEHARGNAKLLKKVLLDHYASTVFNVCECQELPKLPGPPLKLQVDPDAVPVACHKVQPIPIHWQEKVHKDLLRDVAIGVLEKVPKNTPTTWLSRMVVTAKANGEPRRTVDFQQLNKHMKRQTFALETPWQLASKIPGNSLKTVVDNWNGYHSVPLDEGSKKFTAFLTQFGRFQYKSAAQGSLNSGDAFNERMHEIFIDFHEKVRCVDDVAIWSGDMNVDKHFLKVAEYIHTCAINGIVLNPMKMQFCEEEVEFAGFIVGKDSIRPCPKMLNAIRDFPTPKDISGVRAWFGLVNQVSYAFAITDCMQAFRHLLSPKTPFQWTQELEQEFINSKEFIIKQITEGVKSFDLKLRTCVATDFSGKGVGFMLLQKTCKCTSKIPNCCVDGWKTVLVGSRFLHDAEHNYAPVEGECLAVVYGLRKCRYFVMGCKDLVVVTDHKPLLGVLNDRSLADMDNRRLLLLKEKTLEYKFEIFHVPGRLHVGPDATSRYPSPNDTSQDPISLANISAQKEKVALTVDVRREILDSLAVIEPFEEDLQIAVDQNVLTELQEKHSYGCCLCEDSEVNIVTWEMLREASVTDEEIQLLREYLQSNKPTDGRKAHPKIRPYLKYIPSIYELKEGVLMLGDRIIIPKTLRTQISHLLHAAHQGVDRMKGRASSSVYWPGIVADIEKVRESCSACHKMAKSNPSLPPFPLPEPEYPFQHLAADYFNYRGKDYCVVVDRFSNWPEIFMSDEGGAKKFTNCLRQIFSTFGVCEELATDGASIFTGGLTQSFLRDWGVKHRLSSVANPHSNCRAEIAVKQSKRILTDNINDSGNLDKDSFHRALLSYRNTPDQFTKVSPAKSVFGRDIRDSIPMLQGRYSPHEAWKEALDAREQALAKRQYIGHEKWSEHTKNLPALQIGDNVHIQNVVGNHPRRWERTGTVVECKEYDQYNIKLDGSGRCTLRNRKHLRKFSPPQKNSQKLPAIPSQLVEQPMTEPEAPIPATVTAPTQDRRPAEDTPTLTVPAGSRDDAQEAEVPAREPPRAPTPILPEPNDESAIPVTNRPQRQRKPNQWLNSDTWDLSITEMNETILHALLKQVKSLLELLATQVASQHRWGRR